MAYTVQAGESYASIAAKLGNPRAFLNLMKANGGRGLQPGDRISLEGIDEKDPYISNDDMAAVKNWDASQGYRSTQPQVQQGYMQQAAQAGPPAAANIQTQQQPLSQRYMNAAVGTMPAVAQGNYGMPMRTAAGPTQLAKESKYGAEPQIVKQNQPFQPSVSTYGRRILPQQAPRVQPAQPVTPQNIPTNTTKVAHATINNYKGREVQPITNPVPDQVKWKTYREMFANASEFTGAIQNYIQTGDETQLPLYIDYATQWAMGLSYDKLRALGYVPVPGDVTRWVRLDSVKSNNPSISYNYGSYNGGGYSGGWGGGGGGGGGGTIGGGSGGVGGLINWRIG